VTVIEYQHRAPQTFTYVLVPGRITSIHAYMERQSGVNGRSQLRFCSGGRLSVGRRGVTVVIDAASRG
jgi:hypothetical protein